jgi:hypothetical protein
MDEILEAVHRHLAKHRGHGSVHPLSEQTEAGLVIAGGVEQATEDEGFPKDRGRLRERQRSREMEDPLIPREAGVEAVPQFVGHGEHISPARREVQKYVWVDAWHRVRAKRSTPFMWAHGRVDPLLIEEAPCDASRFR